VDYDFEFPLDTRDNDTCDTYSIDCGFPICGEIDPAFDVDWYPTYVFSSTPCARLIADVFADGTSGHYPFGKGLDPHLKLYAADCLTLLTEDDNSGDGNDSRIDTCLPVGIYMLRITGVGNSTGPYILMTQCDTCVCDSIGRCCYCDSTGNNPNCAMTTQSHCLGILHGVWDGTTSCAFPCSTVIAPPLNDRCPGFPITACPYEDYGNTCCANPDYVNCVEDPSIRSRDVVYNLTLPDSCLQVTVSLCGAGTNFDSGLEVRYGNSCPGDYSIACNDDYCGPGLGSQVTFTATGGITYYIIIHSFTNFEHNSCGNYFLNVTCDSCACPIPSGANQCVPAGSSWGVGVAIDNISNIYYTQYLTNPYTIFQQSTWCNTPIAWPAVDAGNISTQIRIEEMTWDCVHNTLWGASRSNSVNGTMAQTRIYTIWFNALWNRAECTFRFTGDGVSGGSNYPTTGLTFDPFMGANGTIWQHIEDGSATCTPYILNALLNGVAGAPININGYAPSSWVSGISIAWGGNRMYVSHGVDPTITLHSKSSGTYLGTSFDIATTACAHRGLECDPYHFGGPRLLCAESDNSGGSSPAYLTAYPDGRCVCGGPILPPPYITITRATGLGEIRLDWEADAVATSYNVYGSDASPSGPWTLLGTTTVNSYVDAGAISAQFKRFYQVTAEDTASDSLFIPRGAGAQK
jgi:hypothetical protein